ncbi:MAG: hypothetical protein ABL961_18500, partial [Vicinamibacterales bacterium]
MPAGKVELTTQTTDSGGVDPHSIVTYTSQPLMMNNHQPVPDGAFFTVDAALPGDDAQQFGVVVSPDEDPGTLGIQVRSRNGVLQFTIDYPAPAGAAIVLVGARDGTAAADDSLPLH